MPEAPRHSALVRYFGGQYGQIYSQAVLLGPAGTAKVEMQSYLALYADRDFPYVPLTADAPTPQRAISHGQALSFPTARAQAESRNARAAVVGTAAEIDEALWHLGVEQVGPLNLPVIFMSWMRVIATNQPKVTLWYPNTTQGRWALARFQAALRRRQCQ